MGTGPLIYAHRGVWTSLDQQNSPQAIDTAHKLGFGVETDFRSHNKRLVVSHDPFIDNGILGLDEFNFQDTPVAMNIKEDGLSVQFREFLDANQHELSFIFDGSIPEMAKIRERGLPHALRLSEFEKDLPWETRFIWVDAFVSEWWLGSQEILDLQRDHFLVFVSPELHGRNFEPAWQYFRRISQENSNKFGICTDLPSKLKEFLSE
jgi:hypothetical protein